MYPLPDLEYLIGLVSLDVRFQPLVRRFRPLRGVVLALLLCHLPAMYRARFVPVFHNPTTSPENHDKHLHKCRCEYHSINDDCQPHYLFCHPITLLMFRRRGYRRPIIYFTHWDETDFPVYDPMVPAKHPDGFKFPLRAGMHRYQYTSGRNGQLLIHIYPSHLHHSLPSVFIFFIS